MSVWGDALAGSLATLPAVAALLAFVAWWGRRRGARRLPPRWLASAAAALALLGAASLAHRSLPLPDARPVLAAALFALVLAHAAVQLRALRPLLDGPGRPSALFLLLPFAVYCCLVPWAGAERQPDGDEPYYLLLAHSLAYDLDTDLADEYEAGESLRFMARRIEPQPGDPRGPGGQVYSRHDALLPAVLALPYRLGGRTGALVAMAALAAALAWATLALARRAFPARPAEGLLAYGVVAFAPPLLTYAHQVWVEVPAALAAAVALERTLALTGTPEGAPVSPSADGAGPGAGGAALAVRWLPLALALAALPLLKIRFTLVAAPLVLLLLLRALRGGPRSRLLGAGAAAILAATVAAVLASNWARYGNPLKIHAWSELALGSFSPDSYARGLLGLFWDAAFGLFFFSPVWLLAVPGIVQLARSRRALAGGLALVALPYLAVTAPRTEWYGGWSPPFRYGMVLLPILALTLVPLLGQRRRPGARTLLALLGLATAALTLVWLAVPGLTYDLADGRTRLLDALSASLGADAARLFPSYVRPRLASWIWPPATAAGAILLWWWPTRRRPRRPPVRPAAAVAAGTLMLLGLAAVPLLARGAPSGVVELEDPWIDHRGGHLQPGTWVVARTLHRQGWVIRPFEEVRVPLVPGGDRVELVLVLEVGRNNPGPLHLEVAAGEEVLEVWTPEEASAGDRSGVVRRVELGPFDWPGNAGRVGIGNAPPPLVLRAVGPSRPGRQNGFLLDRLEVRWL